MQKKLTASLKTGVFLVRFTLNPKGTSGSPYAECFWVGLHSTPKELQAVLTPSVFGRFTLIPWYFGCP